MPQHITCTDCGVTLLGVRITDDEPTPINRESCPRCGGTEFEWR